MYKDHMEPNALMKELFAQLEAALVQQTQLNERKKVIDEQVENLLDAVRALHKVYGGEFPEAVAKQIEGDLGITDQVRQVFKTVPAQWLVPMQVRTMVEARGFSLAGYSNPMAVIHQVLKRLDKQGELQPHAAGTHYMLKPQVAPAPAPPAPAPAAPPTPATVATPPKPK